MALVVLSSEENNSEIPLLTDFINSQPGTKHLSPILDKWLKVNSVQKAKSGKGYLFFTEFFVVHQFKNSSIGQYVKGVFESAEDGELTPAIYCKVEKSRLLTKYKESIFAVDDEELNAIEVVKDGSQLLFSPKS